MRQGSIEEKIKSILEETNYSPSEQSWQKLQAALQQNKPEAMIIPVKKKVMLFQPLRWAAAAAVLGILGYGIHFSLQDKSQLAFQNSMQLKSIQKVNADNHLNKNLNIVASSNTGNSFVSATSESLNNHSLMNSDQPEQSFSLGSNYQTSIGFNNLSLNKINASNVNVKKHNEAIVAFNSSFGMSDTRSSKNDFLENFSSVYQADYTSGELGEMRDYIDPFVYSIGLNAGVPTVGVFQAAANFNIRKDLGSKMFVDMGIEGAMTDVQEEKALYYKRNLSGGYTNVGESGSTNLGLTQADADGSVNNTYSNKVWSVGVTPMIGVKITPKLSFAVGGDLCRNFNNSLILKENEFVKSTNLKGTENPVKWVNTWDAGARSKVALKLNDNISISGQYRKGFVNYMINSTGDKIKNSIVSLGMQVNLNP